MSQMKRVSFAEQDLEMVRDKLLSEFRRLGKFALISLYFLLSIGLSFITLPSKSPVTNGHRVSQADAYQHWRACEIARDEINGTNAWAKNDLDPDYESVILRQFKANLETYRRNNDFRKLFAELHHQSSRNVCKILTPTLYGRSNLQTKKLIHDYVREVRRCINYKIPPESLSSGAYSVYMQERRRMLEDMQKSLGRTTLVLQGGAMLSMCHIGVVRALHRRGLLPKVITGTGTGALIAALVGSFPENVLTSKLNGGSIKLDAFLRAWMERQDPQGDHSSIWRSWRALVRRTQRLRRTGHLFNIDVVTDCTKENLGDITFEEAYEQSKRILNITIAMPNIAGTPHLLNVHTAPHVLIRTAVAASLATSKRLYAPVHLLQRDDTGAIVPYVAADASECGVRRAQTNLSPMERAGQMDNVNHYVVSQTRPYVVPFVQIQEWADQKPILGTVMRVALTEGLHWLQHLNQLGLLPKFIQRILMDEIVPSSAARPKVVITPALSLRDYLSTFDLPTQKKIDQLADKGEQSVWPLLYQLKIRCAVELEVDAAWQPEPSQPSA